jgi:polysaccharide export outer membrane protein
MANVQAGSTSRVGSNQISLYTIDSEGYVEIPVVGKIKIGGLSRTEATEKIQSALRDSKLLIDAVVTINVYEQYISVLGEVKNPSRINVTQDNITLLEALAQVGDLTIHARRDRILVLRKEGNETKPYYVDIRSKDLMNSPVYYLSQSDIVYVEPNKVRTGQSTVNDNNIRAISTWLSISSFLVTLAVLIFK